MATSTRTIGGVAGPRTPEPFRSALRRAIDEDGRSQPEVARAVSIEEGRPSPWSSSMISDWIVGRSEPAPPTVCALERALDLPIGSLTLHLGYLPPYARGEVRTVEEAIQADPELTKEHREILLAAYAASVRASSSSGSAA